MPEPSTSTADWILANPGSCTAGQAAWAAEQGAQHEDTAMTTDQNDLRERVAQAKAAYGDHRDIASQQEPDATSKYIAALDAMLAKAREDAWREAIDVVHYECWSDGPMSETLMAEQATTALAIAAIRALIDRTANGKADT